jgi:hypothetical protein
VKNLYSFKLWFETGQPDELTWRQQMFQKYIDAFNKFVPYLKSKCTNPNDNHMDTSILDMMYHDNHHNNIAGEGSTESMSYTLKSPW